MTPDQGSMARWCQVIGSEYGEMPGLSLTKPQMQRLWGLEPDVCDLLVDALVAARVLRRTADDTYVSVAHMAPGSRQVESSVVTGDRRRSA